jgi:sugar phosphate isomerase/epimerase
MPESFTDLAAPAADDAPADRGLPVPPLRPGPDDPPLRISLAQWSLREDLWAGRLDPLDFGPHAARTWGIRAVEHVNSFFADRARDARWLAELRRRAEDAGVRSLLIMCDGEGRLGDPDDAGRARAVENHRKWLEAAEALGCHAIRVNAASAGSRAEQARLAADGLRRLCELGEARRLNVIVENHGGHSSDGSWLADVMRRVDHPRVGTLPDFGNFALGGGRTYDRYRGTAELMPWARAVSAKSHDFDPATGEETEKDYDRLLGIVLESGYRGWIGIEYEGSRLPADAGVAATKRLIERVLRQRGLAGPAADAGAADAGDAAGSRS